MNTLAFLIITASLNAGTLQVSEPMPMAECRALAEAFGGVCMPDMMQDRMELQVAAR